jgi:flagellar protein FliL
MASKAAQLNEASDDESKPASSPKKGSKRRLLMIAVLGCVAIGAAGAGYYAYQKGAAQEDQKAAARKKMVFFDLPEITANLASAPGQDRPSYLRLKIAIEVADAKMVAEIQPLMPRIIDNFQVFLRELRPQDLDGSAGTYRLKDELVRRINAAVYPARVEAILFKEVLVQ